MPIPFSKKFLKKIASEHISKWILILPRRSPPRHFLELRGRSDMDHRRYCSRCSFLKINWLCRNRSRISRFYDGSLGLIQYAVVRALPTGYKEAARKRYGYPGKN